ncbi:MAG TPA: hypothetical protein VFP92_08085 [Rhodanobacteraceae bacterium]|nr:hypothetical protein [Rhodanobacteraceae bacterium]
MSTGRGHRLPTIVITRAVSCATERCEPSYLQRHPIDLALARGQHDVHEQALRDAGCEVRQLAEQPDWADSVFVEDTAIVLKGVVVSARSNPDGIAQQ